MLKKPYRELNDGLGTVRIELDLSAHRLSALQQKADFEHRSVDAIIGDAISEYLATIQAKKNDGFTSMGELLQIVEALRSENIELKMRVESLSKQKTAPRKKLKRTESSTLQMWLPFEMDAAPPKESPLRGSLDAITI